MKTLVDYINDSEQEYDIFGDITVIELKKSYKNVVSLEQRANEEMKKDPREWVKRSYKDWKKDRKALKHVLRFMMTPDEQREFFGK